MKHNPLAMKMPCENCPFRREGSINLRSGRLESIIDDLVSNDHKNFYCHKSVHGKNGGQWDDEQNYTESGNELFCAGAAAYLMKIDRPSIAMRYAFVTGLVSPVRYKDLADQVIDPI